MKIKLSQLRRIIREEVSRLHEMMPGMTSVGHFGSDVPDPEDPTRVKATHPLYTSETPVEAQKLEALKDAVKDWSKTLDLAAAKEKLMPKLADLFPQMSKEQAEQKAIFVLRGAGYKVPVRRI